MKLESFREDWPVTWAEHEIVELRHGAKMSFRAKLEWLESTLEFARQLQSCPRRTATGELLPPLKQVPLDQRH